MTNYYQFGREVFEEEIHVLQNISDKLDDTFDQILTEIMTCQGKVILIGMGKSGHIARKIAATMSSLGTCAISLSPAECMHGDLGMIQRQDVVVLISYSGESDEIIKIIPGINTIGASILAFTGNRASTLARSAKYVQCFDNVHEVGPLRLAPTSSSTAVLVYGDALAVAAARLKGFDKKDFSIFHPAGSLGKRLTTRTVDLMQPIGAQYILSENAGFGEALAAMLNVNTDLLPIINKDGCLIGIITNGDLNKRLQETDVDIRHEKLGKLIHRYPHFIENDALAIEALRLMAENHIHAVPVVRNDQPIGIIHQTDILKYGIFL